MWLADPHTITRAITAARAATSLTPPAPAEALLTDIEPDAAWVLVALATHEHRQRWLADVVRDRLGGDLQQIGRAGAFGHPEHRPQHGTVPGLPDWEYFFHGVGCCLTHKVDRTTIDVDFDRDGGFESIDPGFYTSHLRAALQPELPEKLIRHPPPCDEAWMTDLPALTEAGCIDTTRRIRLTDAGRDRANSLAPIADAISDFRRRDQPLSAATLALRLCDARLAHRLLTQRPGASTTDAPDWLVERARQQARDRAATLRARIASAKPPRCKPPTPVRWLARANPFAQRRSPEPVQQAAETEPTADQRRTAAGHALQALAALGDSFATTELALLLAEQPPDSLLSTAVRIVAARADLGVLEDFLLVTLKRLSGPDNAYLRTLICRALLREPRRRQHPYFRDPILAALTPDAHASEGEAGLLLYLVDPAKGLAKLARALGHSVPMARSDAAAALALIGTPDAVRTLVEFTHATAPDDNREARAALLECPAPEAWDAVRRYEAANPEPPPPPPETVHLNGRDHQVMRMDDLVRRRAPEHVRWTLNEWRDQYAWISETHTQK